MKAKLIFTLPEEQDEFNNSIKGSEWHNVCREMDIWLRNNTKYAPDNMSEQEYKAYEKCREHLQELMGENGLTLY